MSCQVPSENPAQPPIDPPALSPPGSLKRTLDPHSKDSDGENLIEIDPPRKKPHLQSDEDPAMNVPEAPTPELPKVHPSRDIFTEDDHVRLDGEVLPMVQLLERSFGETPDLAAILSLITCKDEILIRLGPGEADAMLLREPQIKHVLLKAWKEESFRDVRQLDILWPVPPPPRARVPYEHSVLATIRSWDYEYVGNVDNSLFQHMVAYYNKECSRYVSIIQSSGMGKSRAVDELSKQHLVVPINLGKEETGFPLGFPPTDLNVCYWFLKGKTREEAFTRAYAFLCALFDVLLDCLKEIDAKIAGGEPGNRAKNFRDFMTEGQTFSGQGAQRIEFYKKVLKTAEERWVPATEDMHPLKKAAENLMKYLDPEFNRKSEPVLIISIDEAHPLTDIMTLGDNHWSKISELKRALRAINDFPCFTLFLSTTGKVHQFAARRPREVYSSNRIEWSNYIVIPPFSQLGFDQFAEKAESGRTTLEEVSALDYVACLGRPLFGARYKMGGQDIKEKIVDFAGLKLLCRPEFFPTDEIFVKNLTAEEKMACMSVRIPFEFDANTLDSQAMEMTLVEKHMRVYLGVDVERETIITVAPSEPLLAEASYRIMRSPAFNLPGSLLAELERSGVRKSIRGGLIAAMLCLEARDAAAARLGSTVTPVNDFIQELLVLPEVVFSSKPTQCSSSNDETFGKIFGDSKIYFNHFVEIRNPEIINRKYLWRLIIRGAACLCGDSQHGIDIVIPFLYRSSVLDPEIVSAIFIQAKNNKIFQAKPHTHLFDSMSPYTLRFFNEGKKSNVPVIRMVFALASNDPTVEVPCSKVSTRKEF